MLDESFPDGQFYMEATVHLSDLIAINMVVEFLFILGVTLPVEN